MNKDNLVKTLKMVITIIFVLVTFQWSPNGEPDMSHYELYQEINNNSILLGPIIPHPTTTVQVDISEADLRVGTYYLKAVDTEGFRSSPSNKVTCDQECIDRYLESGNIMNIVIKEVERKL